MKVALTGATRYIISTNIPMDGGGVVIGDRIQVFIEIEAVLNPPQPTT